MKRIKLTTVFIVAAIVVSAQSVKAQSLEKKLRTELQQRKNHRDNIQAKVREQQQQQQEERKPEAGINRQHDHLPELRQQNNTQTQLPPNSNNHQSSNNTLKQAPKSSQKREDVNH